MAPWPAPALAREFPPAFDRAFSDRFGGRDLLVRFHHGALLRVFGVSSLRHRDARHRRLVLLAGRGRPFARPPLSRHAATSRRAKSTTRSAELARRREWLAARGIAYVVVVVPEKFTIYPEHLPRVGRAIAASLRRTTACATRSQRDGRVHFVDLRAPLRDAKARERVYYLTDSHWNFNGAIVGYDEIMRAVQRGAAAGDARRRSRRRRGRVRAGRRFLQRRPDPDARPAVAHPRGRRRAARQGARRRARTAARAASTRTSFPASSIYACDRPGLPRAVVLRDSMAIPLIPLLSENFSRVVYVSTRQLDRALIEREKPDVVIEELVERSLHAPGALPMKCGTPDR